MRVDRPTLADLPVSPGMPASLRPNVLAIGPVHVQLDGAIPWSPRRAQDAPPVSFKALRRDLLSPHPPAPSPTLGEREMHPWGIGRSHLKWPSSSPPLSRMGVLDKVGVRGLHLLHALLRGDERAMRSHALGLLGLGPGLTPAGDDLLCGLLAGLGVLGERTPGLRLWSARRVTVLDAAIGQAAGARTTALSRTLLHYAARSLAVEPLLDLLCTLGSGEPPSGRDQLLAIGHSSGGDMLAGALLAARAVLQGGGSS
ncbi:MAG: DUF2877 domain-containing protein [Chloroflexi bacterium]|nr:DUF2877 domain-containing protein [Chloroflexota bacterium]